MGKSKCSCGSDQQDTYHLTTNKTSLALLDINMKPFIALAALFAAAMAAPAAQTGPTHAAFGDLVGTKRGFRPISLEGFSEDDDQDGFVDPIGQVAPVPVYAGFPYAGFPYAGLPLGYPYGFPGLVLAAPAKEKKEE